MSKLTALIGKVVGKRRNISGRGINQMLLVDEDGTIKRGLEARKRIIDSMKEHFECWKLVRDISWNEHVEHLLTDFIFIVRDKKGDFVGVCNITDTTYNQDSICIRYFDGWKHVEQVFEYNMNYEGKKSFEKISSPARLV